jgi:hypothetical protein
LQNAFPFVARPSRPPDVLLSCPLVLHQKVIFPISSVQRGAPKTGLASSLG